MFSSHEVCRLTGITYRQLDYWTRLGLLRPEAATAGSGSRRRFGNRDVIVADALRGLFAAGAPATATAGVADTLYSMPEHPRGTILVGLDGEVVTGWTLLDLETFEIAYAVRMLDVSMLLDLEAAGR